MTLSLGDACRPGSMRCRGYPADRGAGNPGRAADRAWEKDVQVMIEGPGHMALNQIKANMEIQQTICKGAPFYVLGPIVTDVARAMTYHLSHRRGHRGCLRSVLPLLCDTGGASAPATVEDVKEGIIASKIAAHAADICQGHPRGERLDYAMSEARRELNGSASLSWPWIRRRLGDTGPSPRRRERTPAQCAARCALSGISTRFSGAKMWTSWTDRSGERAAE